MGAVRAASGVRPALGIQAVPGCAGFVQHPDQLARAAQRDPSHASRGGQSGSVWRGIYLHVAGGIGDGLLAAILASIILGLRPGQFAKVLGDTARQLVKAELTLAIVLALAMLMNY